MNVKKLIIQKLISDALIEGANPKKPDHHAQKFKIT